MDFSSKFYAVGIPPAAIVHIPGEEPICVKRDIVFRDIADWFRQTL